MEHETKCFILAIINRVDGIVKCKGLHRSFHFCFQTPSKRCLPTATSFCFRNPPIGLLYHACFLVGCSGRTPEEDEDDDDDDCQSDCCCFGLEDRLLAIVGCEVASLLSSDRLIDLEPQPH